MKIIAISIAAMAAIVPAMPATAAIMGSAVAGFGAPMSDDELALSRGGQAVDGDQWFSRNTPVMSRSYAEGIDNVTRSIGPSISDNWWASEGAMIIGRNLPPFF